MSQCHDHCLNGHEDLRLYRTDYEKRTDVSSWELLIESLIPRTNLQKLFAYHQRWLSNWTSVLVPCT